MKTQVRSTMEWLAIACSFGVTALCHAQSIEGPGWFSSQGTVAAPIVVEEFVQTQAGGPGLFSGPGVAEVITPAIEALAAGLESDPKRIFDYVHDHIRYVHYFGSKKGSELTLLEQSGNDLDQCALLLALLRAAGFTNCAYQFGNIVMPFAISTHQDYQHWIGVTKPNTNWNDTQTYVGTLQSWRGFPALGVFLNDTNSLIFHHAWVRLVVGGTNYLLFPAFKASEPIAGIDIPTAMGLNTNDLLTAAGGTSTADYVQNLSESGLTNKLRDYTTNLLASLQANHPNASVDEVLGGWRISPSTTPALPTTLPFTVFTNGGLWPVQEWANVPTNLMSRLTLAFAGTNTTMFLPELQGRCFALTFTTNGLGQLWLDDALLLEKQTTGPASRIPVSVTNDHPFGTWNFSTGSLDDATSSDHSATVTYQRTNASYALLYAFDAHEKHLRQREERLDALRQQGVPDTSRAVVSETLNIMGLNWLLQTELIDRALAAQRDVLSIYEHRQGRMGQESGAGYYLDVYMQVQSLLAASGVSDSDTRRWETVFEAGGFLSSAAEHGLVEQYQPTNLVAASTVKLLRLANANAQRVYRATSNNWTTGANVRGKLTGYDLTALDNYINAGYTLLLPTNGQIAVAGSGSWTGNGFVARLDTPDRYLLEMAIGGGFLGGYISDPGATVQPLFVWAQNGWQPDHFDLSSALQFDFTVGDPVNVADGSFRVNTTDLALGGTEPRGLSFGRHYSSTRRHHNLAGMAHGWTHNYFFNAAEVSAPLPGLGKTTPAQMAPMLVATRSILELYSGDGNAKNWLVTAHIAKWGIDQLLNNGVSVTLGNDAMQFIRQPNGTFTPPAGSTHTLLKTNSAFNLEERNGRTFKFNTAGRLTNIVDQYSSVGLALAYDSSNRVQTATDWKGRKFTFNYSGTPSRLVSVTNNGASRAITFGYAANAAGQLDLTSVTDAEGKTSSFSYDTNHQIIVSSNALNQVVTSNLYDGFGRVVEQYSEGNTQKRWRFFWSGFVNVEEDPAGSRRRFFYDDKQRLTALQDALGNVSRTGFDGQDHVVMTVSALNETNRFEFDGRHNRVRNVDALNFTNQFIHDAQNRLTRGVDARGNTNNFGYNTKHQLTGSTNGAGDWVTFVYDGTDGRLSSRTDPGGITTYAYDANGHLNGVSYQGGLGAEGYLNNALGDVLSRTNARGFVTSFQYNQRRELTNTIAPTNIIARVGYDAAGNVQSSTDARGFTTTNVWSAARKILITSLPATPQGVPVMTIGYDARDWLTRTVNPLQQATLYTNDVAGRQISVTDPLLRTTRYSHDADGRKIGMTNAALEATRQIWNARGELIKLTNPATNSVSRVYDAAGNQVALTNRNAKCWQFQFDGANRLTNTITPGGRETRLTYNPRGLVSTVREPSTQTSTNLYDGKGRLTNRLDAVAATVFRYDLNNNVTNIVENGKTNAWTFDAYDRVSSYRDADGNLIQYRYDANGNLTNLIYPGNRTVTYAYDSLNRLTNISDWANRQTRFTYDLASRLKSITRPNNTVREINFDAAGQTTNIIERTTGGSAIAFFKHSFNNAARVQWDFTAPPPHAYTPPTRLMTFDEDNRLAMVNGSNVVHDADGNLTSGPLTNDTFISYSYDARNRLTNAAGVSYAYDPSGNRLALTNGTNVTRFVINPNAPLSQVLVRVKGSVTNYYIHGLGLLYEITETTTSTNTRTYHYDSRGSTVALTDDNGQVTGRVEYSVYGSITYRSGTNDTPFLYNGRYGVQTDPNGLLYMRVRYYNPYLCRFLNADPSGFAGGLNFYAYADGNPISLIDPFGLGAVGEFGGGSWFSTGFTSTQDASLLGSPAPSGYSPYLWGQTPDRMAYAGLYNVASLVNNTVLGTFGALGWSMHETGLHDVLMSMPMFAPEIALLNEVRLLGAAKPGTRALQPMANAAFETGTIRSVAGYELGGNAGLVGNTYNVNLWALYQTEASQGPFALVNALRTEARAAGASQISITGNAVINTDLLNISPGVAGRLGFQFQQVNPTTILLQGPVHGP